MPISDELCFIHAANLKQTNLTMDIQAIQFQRMDSVSVENSMNE